MLVNHPERLGNNPRVKSANMYGIELKESYLIEIFDAWKKEGETGVVRNLNENGIQIEDVGSYFKGSFRSRVKSTAGSLAYSHPICVIAEIAISNLSFTRVGVIFMIRASL